MESKLDLSFKKSVPLLFQSEIAECGLASSAMVASYHDHQLDITTMGKCFNLKTVCYLRQILC
jgi:ATP-binding cassette subfamily B protein RaxB